MNMPRIPQIPTDYLSAFNAHTPAIVAAIPEITSDPLYGWTLTTASGMAVTIEMGDAWDGPAPTFNVFRLDNGDPIFGEDGVQYDLTMTDAIAQFRKWAGLS